MEEVLKQKREEEKKGEEEHEEEVGGKMEEVSGKEAKVGGDKAAATPPPPQEEVVLRVYMHCEGCARKVKRSLKGFQGVEGVETDCKAHKVVVKGKKAAEDPVKVAERVHKKSGRKVELLSPPPPPAPVPPPPLSPEKKKKKKEEEEMKEDEKTKVVVLKLHMHCEACTKEIKKRILKMKGVQDVEPDLNASQVAVRGVFEQANLVEHVYKLTGKHAVVVEGDDDPPPAPETKKKTADGCTGEEDKQGSAVEDKERGVEGEEEQIAGAGEKAAEQWRRYQRFLPEYVAYPPPFIFSDDNPNACAVM